MSRYQASPSAQRWFQADGAPQALFQGVRAALVAARHEGRPGGRDRPQGSLRVVAAADMGRVCTGADDHEIVPGDLTSVLAMPFGDEAVLGLGVVDQDKVGVAARRRGERLAGALGEDPHLDAGGRGEGRQDMLEEPGILHRCRRGQDDRFGPDSACDHREQPDDRASHVSPSHHLLILPTLGLHGRHVGLRKTVKRWTVSAAKKSPGIPAIFASAFADDEARSNTGVSIFRISRKCRGRCSSFDGVRLPTPGARSGERRKCLTPGTEPAPSEVEGALFETTGVALAIALARRGRSPDQRLRDAAASCAG